MSLPIIPDVFQATLLWTNFFAPRPATTTLHFKDAGGTGTPLELFTDIQANVTAGLWNELSDSAGVDQVLITPLDGNTAQQSFNTGRTAKWKGAASTDCILQGAIVVSLKSNLRGPRGRNRIFLPWMSESEQLNGTILAAGVTAMNTAWVTFAAAMTASGWPIVAASAKYQDAHPVTNVVVRPFVKTQRRRARR